MVEFPLVLQAPFYVCVEGCLSVYSKRGAGASDFECPVCSLTAFGKARVFADGAALDPEEGSDAGP